VKNKTRKLPFSRMGKYSYTMFKDGSIDIFDENTDQLVNT